MKNIAVFSFFESYNIGDTLIASQIKALFSQKTNCDFFDITTGKPTSVCGLKAINKKSDHNTFNKKILSIPFLGDLINTAVSFKSKSYKNVYNAAKNYETVIFAGGNQVMELKKTPTSIIGFYKLIKLLKKEKKQICFCFCGIGPFNSKQSEKLAKKVFSFADFISVRDRYSLEWAQKFCPSKSVELWCDPVLLTDVSNNTENVKNAIGINTYFGYIPAYKSLMMESFVKIIKEIRNSANDLKIYLFSSELTDIDDITAVKKTFQYDSNVIIRDINSKEDLFNSYNEMCVVLATRMHTAITATISKVPVLTVAWQEKVSSFMSLTGNEQYNFTINDFTEKPHTIAQKLLSSINNSEKIVNKNAETLKLLRENTTKSFDAFLNTLED